MLHATVTIPQPTAERQPASAGAAPSTILGGDAWVVPFEPGGPAWITASAPQIRVVDQRRARAAARA
ncbi:MAG: hypothetical protein AAGC46_18230 [Solirubrobacteraceae bacterium]|nr:hypothetical protein [Patulibacter sp.]